MRAEQQAPGLPAGRAAWHAMWDAKNKTVSGCYENAFIARQNKSIKTDELPAEHSDTKTETTSMLHSAGIFVKTLVQWN